MNFDFALEHFAIGEACHLISVKDSMSAGEPEFSIIWVSRTVCD